MSRLVVAAANQGSQFAPSPPNFSNLTLVVDAQVISDARRMCGEPEESDYIPTDPREFTGRIFHTCYMGTENSSADTRQRAKLLSESIGR
jgi:hypothetical protein